MNAGNSGAVFFLGTRAHYQVLQQPDRPYDVENGNTSTETIYQNTKAHDLWTNEQTDAQNNEVEFNGEHSNWGYSDAPEVIVDNSDTGVKRRAKRRPSETALCDEQDMRPVQLNATPDSTPKSKNGRRRVNLLGALGSLASLASLASRARRPRRLQPHGARYLRQLEAALTSCTYRESCRCFECQSRYFECDDEDEFSSEDDEYKYAAQYYASQVVNMCQHDDDDEVFVDSVPDDSTSTDMLLEPGAPPPPPPPGPPAPPAPPTPPGLELEVAAGTPVVLNYLLTHPVTCAIQ